MSEISEFVSKLNQINWFARCGIPNKKYHVLHSIFDAYDGWNPNMLAVWEPHICQLEQKAQEILGDAQIDTIFSEISLAIDDILWEKWNLLIEKQYPQETGLENEMLDMVKRDMAWACIENCLHQSGFFTDLLLIYQNGYFPCAWDGTYPDGKAVVL